MNILIDIGHPAHVHLFKNPARTWISKGHDVIFTIRDRPPIQELMTHYGFEYTIASIPGKGFAGLVIELVTHDWNVLKTARKERADILIGTSVSAAHVALLLNRKSIIFNEDDADYIPLFAKLTYPFAHSIVVPRCLRDKKTHKYTTYEGYHELAYLHPNNFVPHNGILDILKMDKNQPFFLIRSVALKAHHDRNAAGLNKQSTRKLIDILSPHGKVFLSAEETVSDEFREYCISIPPHEMHNLLHYASMVVSDSQTMTIEAAVLGTPAIRCNTFVGKCSVIEELENKYELTQGFQPEESDIMISRITELLSDSNLRATWHARRDRMLAEKIDLAKWITDFVEEFSTDTVAAQ